MYHLFSGERSDAPNSDSDVQHLVSNEIALACALKPGHFYEHCDVPGEKWGEKGEDGGEGREREKEERKSEDREREEGREEWRDGPRDGQVEGGRAK